MSHTPPDASRRSAFPADQRDPESLNDALPHRGGRAGASVLRRAAAILAGLLALFSLGCLAAILILYMQGAAVAPWLIAACYFALPLAFVLMAGLVIDGIRRRRRG